MVDHDIIDNYIQDSVNIMDEKTMDSTYAFLCGFFDKIGNIEYSDIKKSDFINVFSKYGNMSKSGFFTQKSKVFDFLKWMYENGNITVKQLNSFSDIRFEDIDRNAFYDLYYFIDYNDLYDTISEIDFLSGSEFNTFKSCVILSWFGFTLSDMSDTMKNDYNDQTDTIINPNTKEEVVLPPTAADIISEYKHAEVYESRKFGGKEIHYANSQYLFRSYKNGHLTARQLSDLTTVVNGNMSDYRKLFLLKRIYQSGIFSRMYDYETINGKINNYDYDVIKKFFLKDKALTVSTRSELVRKYTEYRDYANWKYKQL